MYAKSQTVPDRMMLAIIALKADLASLNFVQCVHVARQEIDHPVLNIWRQVEDSR